MKNLSILAFVLVRLVLSAQQQPIDHSLKHTMKQDGLSMQFTVLDPDEKGIKRHSTSKTYYWYKAQQVIRTQGGNAGQLLDGQFESFYSNKQLCEKGRFRKGLKTGEWNYWSAQGKLQRTENWRSGLQRKKQLYYDTDGLLYKRVTISGKKYKSATIDSLVEISGKNKRITVYDSLGAKAAVARYRNDVLHGTQESYTQSKKTTVRYRKGALIPEKTRQKKEEKEPSGSEEKVKKTLTERFKSVFGKKAKSDDPKNPRSEKAARKERPVKEKKDRTKPDPEREKKKEKKKPLKENQ
jgi:antitoxin component YwqK of YwqJK toxin-antitoxin module